MVVVLRILLVLIPIIALLLWLRWRVKQDLDEETQQLEFKRLCVGMAVLVLALFATGLGLRFFDDSSGDVDQVYVPARVEDGKVVPGKFVPRDEQEQNQTPKSEDPPDKVPEDPPADGS